MPNIDRPNGRPRERSEPDNERWSETTDGPPAASEAILKRNDRIGEDKGT